MQEDISWELLSGWDLKSGCIRGMDAFAENTAHIDPHLGMEVMGFQSMFIVFGPLTPGDPISSWDVKILEMD